MIQDRAWCSIACAGSSHGLWLKQQVLKDYLFYGNGENDAYATIGLTESQTFARGELSGVY